MTAFIIVVFISGILSLCIFPLSKRFIEYQSDTVCKSIQYEINSGIAAKVLRVNSFEQVDFEAAKTREWIQDFDNTSIYSEIFKNTGNINTIYVILKIGGDVVYTDESEDAKLFWEFYRDTQEERPIFNKNGEEMGTVTVKVNEEVVVLTFGFFLMIVVLLGIAALIIAKLLSLFLVIPIINPINQLEKKMRALAVDDQETAVNTQLVLKRPLREIESLADSTNIIMGRFHRYSEQLEAQKDILENQNSELEAQNEELIESKLHIQQQQGQLLQSEKMASVGMLTAAITHEINTPIGAINSNAQLEDMLLAQLMNHPDIQNNEELRTIFAQLKEVNDVNLDACSRITEIIRSLKSYSRLDQADFKEANINEGIKSVLVLTHNLLKRRITVHEDYGDFPPVRCFPGQLNQVIMNIIVNASQAIEGEGDIYIRTCQQDRNILISIRDTGVGIKEEDIPKLFDPGYTTKGVGVGLGLGLYISYNIIHNHKGDISVISEPGKGAEFIIRIPMDNETT